MVRGTLFVGRGGRLSCGSSSNPAFCWCGRLLQRGIRRGTRGKQLHRETGWSRHAASDFRWVALVAGGKVIEADQALAQLEQGFEQVGADEAGHADDEPSVRLLGEAGFKLLVGGHFYAVHESLGW